MKIDVSQSDLVIYMLFMDVLRCYDIMDKKGDPLGEKELRDIFNSSVTENHIKEVWDKVYEILERDVFNWKKED